MNITETIRELDVGACYADLRRMPVNEYHHGDAQAEMRKMNSKFSVILDRITEGKYTCERVTTVNHNGEHIIYGVVVTRER